jgi:hypothetical protein
MIMHLTTLCTPCIAFMLVSHTCIIAIGHEEQGPEEIPEPGLVEAIAMSKTKADTDASNHNPWVYLFFLYFNYDPWMCIKL